MSLNMYIKIVLSYVKFKDTFLKMSYSIKLILQPFYSSQSHILITCNNPSNFPTAKIIRLGRNAALPYAKFYVHFLPQKEGRTKAIHI